MFAPTLDPVPSADAAVRRKLLVTRKVEGGYRSLGFLAEHDDGRFSFEYLAQAVDAPWFVPLPGLKDTHRRYVASELFPIFATRVIEEGRPDRDTTLKALALPRDSTPFEILERSGGRRVGDEIEVVPVPTTTADNVLSLRFFVHGVRYMGQEAQDAIAALSEGQELAIEPEPENPVDPFAIRVKDHAHLKLGCVPAPLTGVVAQVLRGPAARLRVVRANGAAVGFHLRLLVQLDGTLPRDAEPPFTGSEWRTSSEA